MALPSRKQLAVRLDRLRSQEAALKSIGRSNKKKEDSEIWISRVYKQVRAG